MNREPIYTTCRRPGCRFPRSRQTRGKQVGQLKRECSAECTSWCIRARRAVETNDAAEAAWLMRLNAALDARRRPGEPIAGLTRTD